MFLNWSSFDTLIIFIAAEETGHLHKAKVYTVEKHWEEIFVISVWRLGNICRNLIR